MISNHKTDCLTSARVHRQTHASCIAQKNRGFTLIELSIVILISGMLLAAIFSVLNKRNELDGSTMDKKFDRALTGIAEFYRITGRYPCPADPTLAFSDPDFGEEDCSILASGGVMQGMLPVRLLDVYLGCSGRDRFGIDLPREHGERISKRLHKVKQIVNYDQAITQGGVTGNDRAKYGVVADQDDIGLRVGDMNDNYSSRNSTCLNDDDAIDVFGSRITYTVTEDSTSLATIGDEGEIIVVDENDITASRAPVHFILVSHGADLKGTRLRGGEVSGFACNDIPGALDQENCNNDEVFRIVPTALLASTGSADHFDDRVEFSLVGYMKETDIWKMKNNEDTMVLGPTANGAAHGLVIGSQQDGLAGARLTPNTKMKVAGGNVMAGNIQIAKNGVDFSAGGLNIAQRTVALDVYPISPDNYTNPSDNLNIVRVDNADNEHIVDSADFTVHYKTGSDPHRMIFDAAIPSDTDQLKIYYQVGVIDSLRKNTHFTPAVDDKIYGITDSKLHDSAELTSADVVILFDSHQQPSTNYQIKYTKPAGDPSRRPYIEFTSPILSGVDEIHVYHEAGNDMKVVTMTAGENITARNVDSDNEVSAGDSVAGTQGKYCYDHPLSLCP